MTEINSTTTPRNQEAAWLQKAMNNTGMANLNLHQELEKVGFTGFANNISMWRNAKTQIPDKWIPHLCKILFSENADDEIVEFLRRRHPELAEYLNLKSETAKANAKTNLNISKKRKKKMEIFYIPKNGTHKGVKFIPFVNRQGKYQGGVDRFKENIEEFDSLEEVIDRLKGRDSFKVRMSHPTDSSVAPSLIKKESLIIL